MSPEKWMRFLSWVRVVGECWEWGGALARGGYGKTGLDGRTVMAHRAAYEHVVGTVSEGLQLDHLCRNRKCVNPAHLEPVTPLENIRRGMGNCRKTHCPQGHEYTPENTYRYPDGRRRCIACRRVSDMREVCVRRRAAYKAVKRAKAA